jgi:hypothetical protein
VDVELALALERERRLRRRGGRADEPAAVRRGLALTARRTDGRADASSLGGARRRQEQEE